MNRADFLKRVGLLGIAGVVAPKVIAESLKDESIIENHTFTAFTPNDNDTQALASCRDEFANVKGVWLVPQDDGSGYAWTDIESGKIENAIRIK